MNLSALKTPGAYISEVNAFPPSVAQASTIPAFVGYTAINPGEPVKISSFVEFEQMFGGAPEPQNVEIVLDDMLNPTDASVIEESAFKLYNSLKLFYSNGGGACYIISVGSYKKQNNTIRSHSILDFQYGLSMLEKMDEPTLIVIPDAIELDIDDLAKLQQDVLAQCGELQDRFAILDVKELTHVTKSKRDWSIEQFRDKIGTRNLKYGAAYYPYLLCNFPFNIRFSDIKWTTTAGGEDLNDVLTEEQKEQHNNLILLIEEVDMLQANYNALSVSSVTKITSHDQYQNENNNILKWLKLLKDINSIKSADLKTFISESIKSVFNYYLDAVILLGKAYAELKDEEDLTEPINIDTEDFDTTLWGVLVDFDPNRYVNSINESESDQVDYAALQSEVKKIKDALIQSYAVLFQRVRQMQEFEENIFTAQLSFYNNVIQYLAKRQNTLPPSGAIAGVYAYTDATRGIWKAPANISLNAVLALTDDINDSEQQDMNIHQSGKSINALRKFTGKGLLVWGARTLDGNNNDWRYINVRRLAIMIEISARNASMNFIFEPNVAQTWVNIKGMLESYLTTLWNDGALAGQKSEHAFYVQVGLGVTMTSDDIINGRMIVKIGYAPIRPAEFIVLEFTQMQQRS